MAGGVKPRNSALRDHGRRFALFGLVGVFNTGVDFLVFTAAILAGVPPVFSNLLAFAAANPLSYFINSRVTFRRESKPAAVSSGGYGTFLTAHLLSLTISTALVFFLASAIGPFGAKAAAVAATVFINYMASAFLVFPQNDAPGAEPGESA